MKNRHIILLTMLFSFATVTSLFFVGCKDTQNYNSSNDTISSTEVPTAESTYVQSNTVETIQVTQPDNPNKDTVVRILRENGVDESLIRRKYIFDEQQLNSTNNKYYAIDRMCNSIDYFTTLQASYIKEVNGKTTWVTYLIDRRTNKAKELIYNVSESKGKSTPTNYYCVDGDYHLKLLFDEELKNKYSFDFDPSSNYFGNENFDKIYALIQKPMADELEKVTEEPQKNISAYNESDYEKYIDAPKRIFFIGKEPIFRYSRSDTVNLAMSSENYFPQNFAFDTMMTDLSKWKVSDSFTEGTTEIIKITGTYNKYDDENLKQTYTLCIDKNTGVIISNQIKNASGNTVEEWNNVEYIVNGEINDDIFDNLKK